MRGQSLLIHLPILLLVISVGLDLFGLARSSRPVAQRAALLLLALGLVGSAISAVLGFQADFQPAGQAAAMSLHQLWAMATLVVFGGLLLLRLAARRGWSPRLMGMYIAFAITGMLTLAIAGFYGAELIAGLGD
jgi:uncharacterized membrane protein